MRVLSAIRAARNYLEDALNQDVIPTSPVALAFNELLTAGVLEAQLRAPMSTWVANVGRNEHAVAALHAWATIVSRGIPVLGEVVGEATGPMLPHQGVALRRTLSEVEGMLLAFLHEVTFL
jgi:hypothetical protein